MQSVMGSVMQPFIRRMGDLTLHALYWMDRVSGNTHGIPREAMRQDPTRATASSWIVSPSCAPIRIGAG